MLSKFQLQSQTDISSYYTVPLVNSTVVISQANDPSVFGIFDWNSAAQNSSEPDFFDIGVTLKASTGSLTDKKDYFISLLQYASNISGDKNFVFTQDIASDTWVINHNLNKFPSVSVVNSADLTVYGNVEYDTLNQVTVTFNAPFTGKAFLN
tara:strand:- start:129 stop:584 length:456 start_codon:yes stop_codon:yes gene_type:complete